MLCARIDYNVVQYLLLWFRVVWFVTQLTGSVFLSCTKVGSSKLSESAIRNVFSLSIWISGSLLCLRNFGLDVWFVPSNSFTGCTFMFKSPRLSHQHPSVIFRKFLKTNKVFYGRLATGRCTLLLSKIVQLHEQRTK